MDTLDRPGYTDLCLPYSWQRSPQSLLHRQRWWTPYRERRRSTWSSSCRLFLENKRKTTLYNISIISLSRLTESSLTLGRNHLIVCQSCRSLWWSSQDWSCSAARWTSSSASSWLAWRGSCLDLPASGLSFHFHALILDRNHVTFHASRILNWQLFACKSTLC